MVILAGTAWVLSYVEEVKLVGRRADAVCKQQNISLQPSDLLRRILETNTRARHYGKLSLEFSVNRGSSTTEGFTETTKQLVQKAGERIQRYTLRGGILGGACLEPRHLQALVVGGSALLRCSDRIDASTVQDAPELGR